MQNEVERLLAKGNDALAVGDWPAARDSYRAALELKETAESFFGLGVALSWLADMHGAIASLERAYASFRRRPDPTWAAGVALRLGLHYQEHLANEAAAAGWLARGARLIQEHAIDDLRGELLLMRACLADDLVAGEAWAREALELARQAGDLDLELCALSQLGALLVEQGRVEQGVALLDEAMAGCLGGEPGSLETVAFSSCLTMRSCASCADFERATQWVRATERFAQQYGAPFLQAECRTVYGAVLLATGDWNRAEAELMAAIRLSQGSVPAFHAEAAGALAELRLAQGRIEEAERLVVGLEGHHATVPALARIHLLRGRPGLAASTVQRALDAIGRDGLEGAVLLELLGEAEVAQGDYETAAERGRTLAALGASLDCPVIVARGERLRGHARACADAVASRKHLDAALAKFVRLDMPFEAARTRLMLAEALRTLEPETAAAEARVALDAFEGLGAVRGADTAAALLRKLGVKAARAGPRGVGTLTKREGEVLALLGEGLSNPEIAARLYVSRKTVEHHVARTLAKLGVRNRTEAAAEAVRRLAAKSATE